MTDQASEVRTHFKNMYQNEVLRHDKTKNKVVSLMLVIILQVAVMFYSLYVQNVLTKALKETRQELTTALDNNYVVWKMDSSCYAQLKSANMIQLLIKD